jgi:hypothetical protein
MGKCKDTEDDLIARHVVITCSKQKLLGDINSEIMNSLADIEFMGSWGLEEKQTQLEDKLLFSVDFL